MKLLTTALFLFVFITYGQSTADADEEIKGYWDWTWTAGSCPEGSNFANSFSGWATVDLALGESKGLTEGKLNFLTIGGGNWNGAFTQSRVDDIIYDLEKVKVAGYDGISYDIEECDSYLDFSTMFAETKAIGLKVLVTISHSAPYGCPEQAKMVNAILADPNVEYMSPQLYTSGYETSPDFAETGVVHWTAYENWSGKFVPSIVNPSHYAEVQSYFKDNHGIECAGYIQWELVGSSCATKPIDDFDSSGPFLTRCGSSFDDALNKCGLPCPRGLDSECDHGERCFANLTPCEITAWGVTGIFENRCGADGADVVSKCGMPCPQGFNSECPSGEYCFAGMPSCVPAEPSCDPLTCTTDNQCQTASCNDDQCITSNKDAGDSCDDGDANTSDDVCNGQGECVGTPYSIFHSLTRKSCNEIKQWYRNSNPRPEWSEIEQYMKETWSIDVSHMTLETAKPDFLAHCSAQGPSRRRKM